MKPVCRGTIVMQSLWIFPQFAFFFLFTYSLGLQGIGWFISDWRTTLCPPFGLCELHCDILSILKTYLPKKKKEHARNKLSTRGKEWMPCEQQSNKWRSKWKIISIACIGIESLWHSLTKWVGNALYSRNKQKCITQQPPLKYKIKANYIAGHTEKLTAYLGTSVFFESPIRVSPCSTYRIRHWEKGI